MADYRTKCLEAKGEQCEICGTTDDIIAHHIDGDRSNNSLENLAPMCKSCHGKVHTCADGYEEWYTQLDESARIYSADRTRVQDLENISFYMTEEFRHHLDLLHNEVNLTYRREYGETLEKNREFRPLLLELGMEAIREMDPEEVRDRFDESEALTNQPAQSESE